MPEPLTACLPDGLRWAWDATALDATVCWRKYDYAIQQGWRLRNESMALEWGRALHEALAVYDKMRADQHLKGTENVPVESWEGGGLGWAAAVREAARHALEVSKDWKEPGPDAPRKLKTRTRATLFRSVVWYCDHYGPDDPIKNLMLGDPPVPAVETSFRLPLPRQVPDGSRHYVLCGYFDGLIEGLPGGLAGHAVRERKTTGSTLGSYYFDGFAPNTQISTYVLASRAVIPESSSRQVLLDVIQVAQTFSRFQRRPLARTPAQSEEFLSDIMAKIREAEEHWKRGYWPKDESACGLYGGCPYRRICSKDPSVREAFLKGDYVKQGPWNPLAER